MSDNILDKQPPEGRQWIRAGSLKIGNPQTLKGLDLSDLRWTFVITRDSVPTPNTAQIRVYNLNTATAEQIQKEYTRVVVQAGYGVTLGTIFDGTTKQIERGGLLLDDLGTTVDFPQSILSIRESPTDTYLDILAGDGDIAFNFAIISVTLARGATVSAQLTALEQALEPYNVKVVYYGKEPLSSFGTAPRGQVLHGQVRDVLNALCDSINATWSIQDNIVEIVSRYGVIEGNTIVLNSQTGLIGTPRQTINGVEFTCLLNPYIRVNRIVKLTNDLIQQAQPPIEYAQPDLIQPLNKDGLYRVIYFQHLGDSRGNDWYTKAVAINVDVAGPLSPFVRYYF